MLEIRPIVINAKREVIGGNMRLRACQEIGLKEVFIIDASKLSAEEQRQFMIKDNVSFGDWNWDTLANEWNNEVLNNWGMDIPNWEDKPKFEAEIVDTGEYDFPEDEIENSHVKMVQLFLTTKTEPNFREWELSLRSIYQTENMTDTIYTLLEKAYKEHGNKKN